MASDELIEKVTQNIKGPAKSWWAGDPRVEQYMTRVSLALDRNKIEGQAKTDIYNRAYEAVYYAIKDMEKAP